MQRSTFCVNNIVCLVAYGLSWARLAHVVASVSVALQTPEASCASTTWKGVRPASGFANLVP